VGSSGSVVSHEASVSHPQMTWSQTHNVKLREIATQIVEATLSP
jgi:hypothetical protein